MGALVYDEITGFVYATGDADDPNEPGKVYIANFTGDFILPPEWYMGPSQWYWQIDGDVHWWQEGEPEPQKPFDIDDAEEWLETLQQDSEDCQSDRTAIHTDLDSLGTTVGTMGTTVSGLAVSDSTQNTNISNNTSAIAGHTATIGTHTTQIAALQAAVSAIQSKMPKDYISGLVWSYDSTDTSRIILDVGVCRNDADTADMVLASSKFVDLDVSGAGGIDTGSKSANSGYFLWLISKADGTTEGMFSLSGTSPTMPSGYVNKRLIGFIYTLVGSSAVQPFVVNGVGLNVEVSQLENPVSGTTTSTSASLALTRICPSLSRMPLVFGNIISVLSILNQRAYVLSKSGGVQIASTPTGLGQAMFVNSIPLDSSRNAWYGSSALTLTAQLQIYGGMFSRRA